MGEFLAQLKLLWPLVMEAPWAFASCAAIFLIAGWAAGRFMYGQRIDILKERIEAYREKLDGATSSEMKQQALKREANLVDLRSSDPVSIGRDQVENTPDKHSIPGNPVLDPKKVGLIDELYPLIHDFSEINVDRIGTIAGDWREKFLNGDATGYVDLMNAALRDLSREFEAFRPIFIRHRYHADLYELDDQIARRINEIGNKLTEVRVFASHFSDRFDEKTIALVDPKVGEILAAVGALRRFLTECLERLAAMRNASS